MNHFWSSNRQKRIQELAPTHDRSSIFKVIGDYQNREYPIYRNARPPDGALTAATFYVDSVKGEGRVYSMNPAGTHVAELIFGLKRPPP